MDLIKNCDCFSFIHTQQKMICFNCKKGRQKNQFILKCSVLYDISNERVLNENVVLDNSLRWKRSFDRAGLMFSNIFQLIKVST